MNLTLHFMVFGMMVLVATIILGIQRKAWKHPLLSFIFYYCVVSLGCDVSSIVLGLVLKKSTIGIMHFWSLFELGILSLFFFRLLKGKKILLGTVISIVALFSLVNVIFIQSNEPIAWYSDAVIAILFIACSVRGLGELFHREETKQITHVPSFWVIIGIMVYFSGTLYSTLFSSKILALEKTSLYGMWYLHNAVLTIKNGLFGMAFYRLSSP